MTRNPSARRAVLAALVLAPLAAGAASASAQTEAWDAIYIGAAKVGHHHLSVTPVKDRQGRDLVRVQVNTVLSLRRGRDRLNMEVRYGTIETRDGTVLRLDTRTSLGQEELRVYGDVIDGTMTLIIEGGGQRQQKAIAWGPDVRGPYGAEMSLSREPMKPGEERTVRTFIPDNNQICTTHLAAATKETIALGGGVRRELTRVEQSVSDPSGKPMPELTSTLWVDDGGQILKTSVPSLLGGVEIYRTTKEGAMAPNGNFDLLAATIIKVARKIPNSERARDVVYRVALTGSDPAEIFPGDQRQALTKAGGRGATLEVRTDAPDAGRPAPETPSEEFLRPNALITSDDPRVVDLARQAVGDRRDPWAKAVAIQEWVSKNLTNKNFGNAFANAAEVARNLEGDCTEHGVLVAAMCRAQGIPARVVVGLVYNESLGGGPAGGFGVHLWNEAFVNDRWVALDAAFNQSAVDATHIKIADTSLDGVAPFEAFLPVLRVINTLKLEPVEVR